MLFSTRPEVAAGVVALVGITCGVGGWLIGSGGDSDDGPDGAATAVHRTFEATVESSADEGRTACLDPIDPTLREDFGGSVCGRVYGAAGTDVSEGARVHVEWFTLVDEETEEPIETFVLEQPGRS